MSRLSVILITKNEIANIRDCLESVRFADEIVVVDSGSTDGTVEVCREYRARVVDADWPGFGPQKNRALDLATGDWVLSIDADERVPSALRSEIIAVVASATSGNVYEIPRLSSFCGREIRHGDWWPDRVARLFRRGHARFSDDRVHERLVFKGAAACLVNPLQHFSVRHLEQVLEKMNTYSTAGALTSQARGKRGGLMVALIRGGWAFFRSYVLKRGFLDGREGFVLAVSTAEGVYYKYLKLYYLERDAP